MYGTQTRPLSGRTDTSFENDVKMYGTQTAFEVSSNKTLFENDVKMYGTQTFSHFVTPSPSLRMM